MDVGFYALTLTATRDGRASLGVDTHWVGWHDKERRVESRQARVVNERFGALWDALGEPHRKVMSLEELHAFLISGGHALVRCCIGEMIFPELAHPHTAHLSGRSGFVDPDLLDAGAEKRAPTPKVRMTVLRRDQRRCRVCGRRPDDHVDVELHVHHIRPWARGGATEMSNLITLCHTCHGGLDPHYDPALFDYLDPLGRSASPMRFAEEVANYARVLSADRHGNGARENARSAARPSSRNIASEA